MDTYQKVETLSQTAVLDCEGPPLLTNEARKAQFIDHSLAHVIHPQRGKMPVMRILQTSACERNCYYCPFQAGRNYRRVTLTPEELARSFDHMQRKKLVQGLFLSSGIIGGGVKAMDKTLATVEILRRSYDYQGYIHLKVMPGAEAGQIEQAARLADRLSINLEGANAPRLAKLAPKKDFWQELVSPFYWLRQNRARFGPWVKLPSLTTQFVVGPAGESDQELLTTAGTLYQEANLSRAYYSAFSPIRETPFENLPKTSATREHRLYQADWLLRFYGFSLAELPFNAQGSLPQEVDPKLAWARQHLSQAPLELNRVGPTELVRVPGIGPKTAQAIVAARKQGPISDFEQLKKLGAQVGRARPYLLLNGRRPDYQLSLPLPGS